ncbi:YjiH family protein [Schinkia azotoformans]|uniref:YjiH family protein n=1 Tax=Schinkia azotoformans TaxID=1454 RepID=UPI002DBE5164|nr:YjiH family protein [Schinkia azotoformans]MEC1720628.1 YjiH family protein [Schinkia azotoformans]MED4411767.1 YjiH family protein [Schinkia azotoformans]
MGIFLFIIPIRYNGEMTIPIAILSGSIQSLLGTYLPVIMMVIIELTSIGTIIAKLFKPTFLARHPFFKNLFDVPVVWAITRVMGGIFAFLVYFQMGPQFIWSENTGGLLLNDLLPILFSVFLFAGLFLPLLLDFGLLEFFGALFTKVMRPIFKLPGRSSIDCIASWLGDGTIGVLLTSKQYEDGFYTKREAAIIGTTFSVVSITFCLVVISQVNLGSMFVPFYATVTLSGLVAAFICPRIPPLSRKPDTFYLDKENEGSEVIPKGYTPFNWGLKLAVDRAEDNQGFIGFIKEGLKNILDMWMGVAPIVMAFGSLALILAEYTPIFQWTGMPFIPLLELMQVPEAKAAAETLVVGFADMFLPSVIGSGIESDMTRFIVACTSVTQLIYMSEVGGLLLGSKIPVTFLDLFVIFLERTLITLPIIVLAAHIIF